MGLSKELIEGAFETASKTLLELLNTPQIADLHFEFDYSHNEVPTMTYRINRYSIKEEQGEEDSNERTEM